MSTMRYHKGAASIFVVITTALLITVVSLSFIRLMVRDQQRASDNDLSRSAYDSAEAGIEDAKRALARYYALDPGARPSNLDQCNAMTQLLPEVITTGEVIIQTGENDAALQQAYTCVKIYPQTDDYERRIGRDETTLIPLQVPEGQSFNRVLIQWFESRDVPDGTAIEVPGIGSVPSLSTSWPAGRPPVLETQLVQTNVNFSLDQFDAMSDGSSNANTLFLYPRQFATATPPDIAFGVADGPRRNPKTDIIERARCSLAFESNYLCAAYLVLPDPVGGNQAARSNAFLRITPRYKGAGVRISLFNSGARVPFDGVQPRIDSTGRANDLYRRIEARVEAGNNIPYPSAAVDVSGNFCKVFEVAEQVEDYDSNYEDCNPSRR